jgi:hypothetical protein
MTEIISAVQAHQYLLVCVLLWPILLALGDAIGNTPLGPYVSIAKLPSWARWLIGQGVAGVSVFVALVSQGVAAPDAALAAFLSAAGVEWTATAGKRLGRAIGGVK